MTIPLRPINRRLLSQALASAIEQSSTSPQACIDAVAALNCLDHTPTTIKPLLASLDVLALDTHGDAHMEIQRAIHECASFLSRLRRIEREDALLRQRFSIGARFHMTEQHGRACAGTATEQHGRACAGTATEQHGRACAGTATEQRVA